MIRVVRTINLNELSLYDKPWFSHENWQKAVGVVMGSAIGAGEILSRVRDLQQNKSLEPLKELPLCVQGIGRPRARLDKESERRFKSFLESARHIERMQEAAVREVLTGKARKNPGGRGTKKSCK